MLRSKQPRPRCFLVEIDPHTHSVTATITAFSTPTTRIVRAGGPAPRLVQARTTQRYVRSLDDGRLVHSPSPASMSSETLIKKPPPSRRT
ncbi:DUF1990 family protein [Aeromicrobium yanjiei]|uniref:DUF1990 family protein n=1 Tax=Aeromicrobium yanjiei TaxID=2662028 RepID=UPI003C7DB24E